MKTDSLLSSRRWASVLRSTLPWKRHARLARLVSLLKKNSRPNLNALAVAMRNVDILALNVKALGYELARQLQQALPIPAETAARPVGFGWKPSVQRDLETDWAAHWCRELRIPLFYHRKLWELAYVLQALYDAGHLVEGRRGIGFGCGSEPLSSYFAVLGITSLVTDLIADDARSLGWRKSNQHATSRDQAFHAHLVDRARFDAFVGFLAMDMNHIPPDLGGFDFCWSVCALEHLGSIANGLAFVENSLAVLRPGGTAVHTTEFNINPNGGTIDNRPTVLFQRRHFEALATRLRAQGHIVASLDFDTGDQPLDHFIDLPPWHDGTWELISRKLGQPHHLKVAIDGFAATCYGLVITKAG